MPFAAYTCAINEAFRRQHKKKQGMRACCETHVADGVVEAVVRQLVRLAARRQRRRRLATARRALRLAAARPLALRLVRYERRDVHAAPAASILRHLRHRNLNLAVINVNVHLWRCNVIAIVVHCVVSVVRRAHAVDADVVATAEAVWRRRRVWAGSGEGGACAKVA
jgi:hypothetical protein